MGALVLNSALFFDMTSYQGLWLDTLCYRCCECMVLRLPSSIVVISTLLCCRFSLAKPATVQRVYWWAGFARLMQDLFYYTYPSKKKTRV